MKDIDFDELDRAVSSVLNSAAPAAAPGSVVDPASPDASGALAARATPESAAATIGVQSGNKEPAVAAVDTNDNPTQPDVSSSTPSSMTPLAIKRRGKFMDVMHPSHDMAPSEPSPSAIRRSPLLPISNNVVPDDEVTLPVADDSRDTLSAMATEETVDAPEVDTYGSDAHESTSDESDAGAVYVDPIDFAAQQAAPDDSSDATSLSSKDDSVSSVTPFIDDARVEKRPLGAFGESEIASTVDESAGEVLDEGAPSDGDTPAAGTDDLPEAHDDVQAVPAVSLPRELQPDIVQVEAVQDEAGLPEEMAAAGHPLFDTSTYHEPVAAKPKKTSGRVLWVLGFLLCLAIGGGAGYVMFTSGF